MLLSRFGGDEFVVLLTQWQQRQELELLVQNLLQRCQQEVLVQQHKGAALGVYRGGIVATGRY